MLVYFAQRYREIIPKKLHRTYKKLDVCCVGSTAKKSKGRVQVQVQGTGHTIAHEDIRRPVKTEQSPFEEGSGLYPLSDDFDICPDALELLDQLFRAGVDDKKQRKSALQMKEALEHLPLDQQVSCHD